MNAYSFVSVVAFVLYLVIGGTALALGPRAATNRLFAALCGAMAVWAFSFAFAAAAPTREAWFAWYRATAPAWLLVPGLALHFCVSVTGRRLRLPLAVAVYGPAVLAAAVGATLALGRDIDFVRSDLGWVTDRSRIPLHVQGFYLYSAVAHVAGLAVVWRWGRRSAQNRERRQARLLVASGALALLVGYALSLVGPGLDGGGLAPNSTPIVGLIWAGGAVLAILRHRFMAITPAFAARQISDSVADVLLLTDAEGRVVAANRQAAEALGRTSAELVGRPWDELTAAPAAARAAFADVRSARQPTPILDTAFVRPGGETLPVAITGAPVPNAAGDLVGVTLVARDLRPEQALSAEVQRRRRAEESLEAEQEDALVLLESVGDAIVSTDAGGRITRLNQPAEALAGCGRAEAIGRSFHEVFPLVSESDGRPAEDLVARVLAVGEPIAGAATVARAPGRGERVIEWSAAPLHEAALREVRGTVLVGRDVTERRRVDAELARVARLESIGTLAGGIAHDFNNLLVGVLGSLELARRELGDGDGPLTYRLAVAERAADRAAGLARQLLTFAQGGAPLRKPLELAGALAEWASFALSGSPVRLDLRLAPDLRPVLADDGQLHQVVQNLVINARQAMPGGGRLVLSGDNVSHHDCPALRPQPHGYVRLAFADEGGGIPPAALPRIFDPFFTTRAGGTGLGLATTFSIVQRHEGHITVESPPGSGAVFRVYLPACGAAPARAPARTAPASGGGRVLVMDDEELVLDVAAAMLTRLGYCVTTAADGEAAIEAAAAATGRGEPFDVAVLDLTVTAGLGGLETAHRLRATHPGLRLIVSSGYASGSVMADYRAHGFVSALPKPYRPEELSAALTEALGATGSPP